MKRYFFFFILFSIVFSAPRDFNSSIAVHGTLAVDTLNASVNPYELVVRDSSDSNFKSFPFDSIVVVTSDSSLYSTYADTAYYLAGLSDSNSLLWYGQNYPGSGYRINNTQFIRYNHSYYPSLSLTGDRFIINPSPGWAGSLIFNYGSTAWVIRKSNDTLRFAYTSSIEVLDSTTTIIDTSAFFITRSGINFVDSSRASYKSYRPVIVNASTSDTNLLAVRNSDSTFRVLTRSQLRNTVDSVRASDTSRGADRLDGYHKSYYDTVGNGAIYCDVPYVPYANSTISYANTILKQMSSYLEIEPLDTTYFSLQLPDNYYVSMASDNAGYIYTIHYYGTPQLLRMTGAVGVYDAFNVKNRSWTEIYYDKIDNILYATASYSSGNPGLYRWNNDSLDFIFYDSVYYSASNFVNGITTTSADIFICAFDNYIYRQIGKVGDFLPYADSRYWTSLCSIGDTVFAFTANAGIFFKTPSGSSFAQYDATARAYGQSWIDSSNNIYVVENSTPMGIYRRAFGTTVFELYHSYTLSDVYGGTYCNGSNYISTSNDLGDVYRYSAYYSQMINRLVVNGASVFNGKNVINVERDSLALYVNGKMTCSGNGTFSDSLFLNAIPLATNDTILTKRTNGSVGYRTLPDSNRASWKADSARKCGDSVLVVAFDDSITINSNAANVYQITLDSNALIMPPIGARSGKKIIFRFIQDSSGHRIVDWDTSAFRFSADLEEPVLTTDSLKTDYLGFIYNAAVSKWDLIGQVLGF